MYVPRSTFDCTRHRRCGGIGAAVVTGFAQQGSLCVDRNAAAGPDLPASLAACRISAHFRVTDVSDAESLRSLFEWVPAQFGVFDLLVNDVSMVLTTRSWRPPRPYL
jgi:NAD(P)-dependent dehydrogenase (short-subunit alcohol dehydrogenase family)